MPENVPVYTPLNKAIGDPGLTADIMALSAQVGLLSVWGNTVTTYTLPAGSASVLGGVKTGTGITIAADGTISANIPLATQSANGLMSSTDKTKLDGLSGGGASTLDGLTDVTAPSPTDGQVLKYSTASGQWVPATDNAGTDADVLATLAYAATVTLDFAPAVANVQTITLAGNLTLSATTNRAGGRRKLLRIIADNTLRNLSFPSGWVWLGGGAPASLSPLKTGVLSLYCFGTSETDVHASFNVQP